MPNPLSNSIREKALAVACSSFALAQHVFLGDQALDDRGASGRSAQPFLAHRFAQFLVLHQFSRAFHGAEQRRFREPRRRFGLALLDLDAVRFTVSPDLTGARLACILSLGFLPVDRQPAGIHAGLCPRS